MAHQAILEAEHGRFRGFPGVFCLHVGLSKSVLQPIPISSPKDCFSWHAHSPHFSDFDMPKFLNHHSFCPTMAPQAFTSRAAKPHGATCFPLAIVPPVPRAFLLVLGTGLPNLAVHWVQYPLKAPWHLRVGICARRSSCCSARLELSFVLGSMRSPKTYIYISQRWELGLETFVEICGDPSKSGIGEGRICSSPCVSMRQELENKN